MTIKYFCKDCPWKRAGTRASLKDMNIKKCEICKKPFTIESQNTQLKLFEDS